VDLFVQLLVFQRKRKKQLGRKQIELLKKILHTGAFGFKQTVYNIRAGA
jgi:hypothetical protein